MDFSKLDSDSDKMWREDRYEKLEELKERIRENRSRIIFFMLYILSNRYKG